MCVSKIFEKLKKSQNYSDSFHLFISSVSIKVFSHANYSKKEIIHRRERRWGAFQHWEKIVSKYLFFISQFGNHN